MFKAVRWIIATAIFCVPMSFAFAQATYQRYDDGFTYRELNAGVDGSPSPIQAQPNRYMYKYHQETGWDDSAIGQGTYRGSNDAPIGNGTGNVSEFMNWRVIYPPGYSVNNATKYPMIIMLHGAGEGGRVWSGAFNFTPADVDYDNNGKNIVWGGQPHLDAVNRTPPDPRAFPGIVIWPQAGYNAAWESGWQNGVQNQNSIMATRIIEHFIAAKNVDPDRIFMHGLSNGAAGTWDLAAKRPDLFAGILPMSGTPSNVDAQTDALLTTPIWLFQGGQDTNPVPQASVTVINTLISKGGNPRYTLYPPLGHDTWETAYSEPDFFTWILSKNKKDIYVFGGDPGICAGGSLKLGFSAGMNSYQWYKDNVIISGATGRYYNANAVGTYTVKFIRRTDGLQYTSNPLVVSTKTASTFTPAITNTGSPFETVNQAGVVNPIIISAPLGYSSYTWYKNGSIISGQIASSYTVSAGGTGTAADAGAYTVKVLEASGCQSLVSNTITVVFNSSQPTSNPPAAPTFVAQSPTSVKVSWADYGTEVSYELWRFRFSNSGPPAYNQQNWGLITSLPMNTVTYTDKTTRPGSLYRYVIRAVLANGTAIFSPESGNYAPPSDLIAPTAPTNLIASNIKDSQVTLTWSPSADNDYVYKYEIYKGSTLVTTITGSGEGLTAPAITTTVTGLIPGTAYVLSVRAIDYSANPSAFADPVSITTLSALPGLLFKYYTFAGNMPGADAAYMSEPAVNGSFDFSQTPTQSGSVASFDISGANTFQNTGDPNQFVYAFDGYIDIPTAGNYRFRTGSDDGSRLYINGTLLVMNDHLQGTTYADNASTSTGDLTLSAGKIPIRVTYFEQGGGNVLDVQWEKTDSPSFGWTTIPAAVLYQSSVTIKNFYLATGASDPSLLASWTANTDGSAGTAPADFTTALQNFYLQNNSTITISNPWTVSGNGSKVIAGDGTNAITVNVNAAYVGPMDAKANATINVTGAIVPVFGTLDATSTVNFNVAGTGNLNIPNATYGNVNFMTPNTYVLPLNATTVLGDLVVADGAKTQGTTTNVSALRVGGDLTFNNTSQNPLPTGAQAYSLSFVGGTNHVVSFNTAINPTFFSIQTDVNDDVSFVNSGLRTYTVGSTLGGGIILKSGSTLNLGTGNLVLSGAGTINPNSETGTLLMNGGDFTFSSTATQNSNVSFDALGNNLKNLTISSPLTTSFNILSVANVSGTVTLNGGLLNPGTGAFLTLLSDSTGINARIAPITVTGASITGSITMQRFMPKKVNKVYRYLSSPVQQATAAMLQQGFPITGAFTGSSIISGVTSKASMFWYNPSQAYVAWPAAANSETMTTGRGYTAYMRKTNGGVKWTVQGVPNQGTIDYSSLMATNGWSLLGNPYPSQIAWTGTSTGGWTVTNINPTVYVRDNTDDIHFTWQVYRTGIGSPAAGQAILSGGVMAAGQAFWVQSTGTPTLKITEAAKSGTSTTFYRTDGGESVPSYDVLTVQLSNGTLNDVAYIAHDANAFENYESLNDAIKQFNSTINITTRSADSVDLVINMTPAAFCEKNIKLNVKGPVGAYSMTFSGMDKFIYPVDVVLTDKFLNTTTKITDGYQHAFSISPDVKSQGDARFSITEKAAVLTALPMQALNTCESNPHIILPKSQNGTRYQAMMNGVAVSENILANGDSVILTLNKKAIGFGTHSITVAATQNICGVTASMDQILAVNIDTLQLPLITYKAGYLKAMPATADKYQWMLDGKILAGKTQASILQSDAGAYQVTVTTGTCTKTSGVFALTGFAEPNAPAAAVYPNPFIDRFTLSLPEPVKSGTAVLYNILGKPVQSTEFSTSDSQNAILVFPNLEPGAYILGVGVHKIKVVKIN